MSNYNLRTRYFQPNAKIPPTISGFSESESQPEETEVKNTDQFKVSEKAEIETRIEMDELASAVQADPSDL
jgi:hypothetical protein